MAAPFNLEDLAKLKSFVEFVAANPAILNLPQLDFLKKLIEQLGGKVPEGTFQMPAGAKCPFGGDVKSENKPTTASAEAEVDEEEIPEMEAESEESEVELDMEANHSQPLLKPNVLYLEDNPPKIVKKQKPTRRKKSTKKGVEKKTISKSRKSGISLKKTHVQQSIRVKKEFNLNESDDQEKIENTDPNDPLFTPQIEIKCELNEDKFEPDVEDEEEAEVYFDSDVDKDFCVEKYDATEEEEDEEEFDCTYKQDLDDIKLSEEEDEDEDRDDDDEPLILLTRMSSSKTRKKKKKTPRLHNCLETCKHKCTTKYTKRQRIDIFDYYWQLSKEDKVNFIRGHIRKPVLTRIRNKKRGNNCCYFLKYYKIGENDTIKEAQEAEKDKDNDNVKNDDLTKVCRKFFEGTLGISNREIKEAIEGYELQPERIVRPLRDIIKEEESKLAEKSVEKPQKPQQFLDPETGNLTDTKPKKKTKRRKPGDPEPERFPRPINCAIRCTFKCHQNFSEEERKQICDSFWSLDFKRRKDFILARIETKDVETPTTPEFRKTNRPTRAYQTRFYLRSGLSSENKRVCKHFMMNTLSINRKFIENAIKYADKTTGNYTGVDGRGKHLIHKISPERKQAILDHINSYPVWVPNKKAKLRCLHHSLSIKRMYKEYRDKCTEDETKPVSAFYYYKVFHDEFRLLFLSNKESKKGRGFLNINPNISHYTGEEPGGCWLDSKGNQLDLRLINPGESLTYSGVRQHQQSSAAVSCSSMDSTSHLNQSPASSAPTSGNLHFNQSLNFATAAAAQHLANFVDTSTAVAAATSLNPRAIFQTTVQNLYDSSNLPHGSNTSSIFRMI
ncbi:uncharacterized protein LOC119607091 isoform X1 [Lucilia sericata]|uniref:uncharacterized protein LOC119607091 isoform X1 n=1 Tax=Lucilia sericata TaxID=13632 RepID=UPI0018A8466E|nr:uncharacterized protein LOC119607091 isoform X1 [Lucilia sericata]